VVELKLERPTLISDINWNQEMNRMVDILRDSIEQQLEMWLKGELQTQFTDLNWQDKEQVRTALSTSGYSLELSGFGEYILYQNKEVVSRLKLQINFSR
jgi:hypothetical protein